MDCDRPPRLHRLLVPCLLLASAALAVSSLVGDSITFDETSHLTSGASYLHFSDFRLSPDHPPLAKMWAAWPLLLSGPRWPATASSAWRNREYFGWGEEFLFELNGGHRLLVLGRCMMVILLVATCAAVYATSRMLFGSGPALLALALAALSPTLLAHGRLVTTDMPLALCSLLVLLTAGRLAECLTIPRVIAAAFAVAAVSLVKFSWPLVMAGPAVMVLMVLRRRRPWRIGIPRRSSPTRGMKSHLLISTGHRCIAMGMVCAIVPVIAWAVIWTCYGWRYSMLAEDATASDGDARASERIQVDASWDEMRASSGGIAAGRQAVLASVFWAKSHRLLPEAYLYGFALTLYVTEARPSYLMGECLQGGSTAYFPVAFAIKTPIPVLLLFAGGCVSLACRPALRRRRPVLLAGLLAFGACYGLASISGNVNIGHRHLLPLYPIIFVLAAAAAEGWKTGPVRWLIGAALAWLAVANAFVYPHYLCYFNELVGGPANGHKYLLDSNLDWGQDLIRLAAYQRRHPGEEMQLAYFGSVDPRCYGIRSAALSTSFDMGEPGPLGPGIYVVSATQLRGVYDPQVRDAFWADRRNIEAVRRMREGLAKPSDSEDPSQAARRRAIESQYELLRRKRLINRLAHRPPDERIGYSLFVYHLEMDDVAELTRP